MFDNVMTLCLAASGFSYGLLEKRLGKRGRARFPVSWHVPTGRVMSGTATVPSGNSEDETLHA